MLIKNLPEEKILLNTVLIVRTEEMTEKRELKDGTAKTEYKP